MVRNESIRPGRRPLRFSYRISLIVALPLLVLAACALIVYRSFSTASANVEELARTLFRDVSKQAGEQSARMIQHATRTMQELQQLSTQSLLSVDHRLLARQFIPILRANPEYSWIGFSRTDGMFIGVT